jgi:hypothetical protein
LQRFRNPSARSRSFGRSEADSHGAICRSLACLLIHGRGSPPHRRRARFGLLLSDDAVVFKSDCPPPITSGSRSLIADEALINADESPLNPDFSDVEKSVKAVVARNQWITKLPHVVQMTYGIVDDNGTVAIVVFVDKQENVF